MNFRRIATVAAALACSAALLAGGTAQAMAPARIQGPNARMTPGNHSTVRHGVPTVRHGGPTVRHGGPTVRHGH